MHALKEEKFVRHNISAKFIWLKPSGTQLFKLSQWIEEGKIRPVVSYALEFSEGSIRKAHLLSESGHMRGKIVICMNG